MIPNAYDTREGWLRAAACELKLLFTKAGYEFPETIRFSVAFPSTGARGKRIGECWHSSASDDGYHTIILRADIAHPCDLLAVLVHELIHASLPLGAGHGKAFRAAAGRMRSTVAGPALVPVLADVALRLGPLPHSKLNFDRGADDKPRKQSTRLLKADCECCGYTVRVAAMWARRGLPDCPIDGTRMQCEAV